MLEYLSLNPNATLYQIKEYFTGKRQVQHLNFFELFEQFISFKEVNVKAASLKPTRTTLTELRKVLPAKVDITCINHGLFETYQKYLYKRGLKPNTVITRLKKLRGFCNYLSDKAIIEDTTYKKFKIGDYKEGKMVVFNLMNEEKKAFVEHQGDLCCITKNRKNAKKTTNLSKEQQSWLRKRGVIESVVDLHKNHLNIEHSRHRAPLNGFTHIFAALTAYTFYKNKPTAYVKDDYYLLPENNRMAA